jgi:polar amino acid transport system substrate-binding protein
MSPEVVNELAPTGELRAGLNIGNFLLVTGRNAAGVHEGVAPDMARALAGRLGVPVTFLPFANAGELADAAGRNVWDVALMGAEPQRAAKIAFSPAYVEIESTYLVPGNSPLQSIAEVDKKGILIVSTARAAYDLWLERNLKNAQLVRTATLDEAFERFVDGKFEALAGLKPRLLMDATKLPGSRVLEGHFTSIQQAIGTGRENDRGAAYIREFVEEMKATGFVGGLIQKYGIHGLTVAAKA